MHTHTDIPRGETHAVANVASDLVDYNLYSSDTALVEAVAREGGGWAHDDLSRFGALLGSADLLEQGHLANRYPPELDTHDRFGHRVDLVRYHPAYHQLMRTAFQNGLHASPWTHPQPGAFVVRLAKHFLQGQVEAGHCCPVTMTFAAIPTLRQQPELARQFEAQVLHLDYDPSNRPAHLKAALTVGMGMTEKQGGSDVRANSTQAVPVGPAGPGALYQLTGHKWFLSAPMCDLFLVLAQAPRGLSCFVVPRWTPDGQKNPLHVIRLKDKMGNRSNASSEVEFRGALGWMVGEEGRGVPTIIEMVNLTRLDCIAGSTSLMRRGVTSAIHHCQQRAAFGKTLIDQPLMQNVLADLALESEAALALGLRMAGALDRAAHDESEADLARLGTAVGKYWVCKRAPQHSYEVMECIGGSGVMNTSVFPRLFTESVINPIWEGSGNVQCLDVFRAVAKKPAVVQSFLAEVGRARGGHRHLDAYLASLEGQLMRLNPADLDSLQFQARHLVDQMALALQAALLVRHAPTAVSDAFCASRLAGVGHHHHGTLPLGTDARRIVARAGVR